MNEIIDKVYKQLESEDVLWKDLESSEEYASVLKELEEKNQKIKEILEKELGREGRTLFFDQEQLYYQLLSISQKFFFKEGYKHGKK